MSAYASSAEQLFAWLDALRARAGRLLEGEAGGAALPEDDAGREHAALAAGVELRLPRLREAFELDELGLAALLALAAFDIDPALRTFVRSLQRDAGRPWIELGLLAELLDVGVRQFAALADRVEALARDGLAQLDDDAAPRIARRVMAEPRVADFLHGRDRLPEGVTLLTEPRAALAESLLAEDERERLVHRVERALATGAPLVVDLHGPAGVGKRFLAEGVAAAVGRPLVIVDLGDDLAARLRHGRREAALAGALLCLRRGRGAERAPAGSHEEPASAPARRLPAALERFFARARGVVLLAGREAEPLVDELAPVMRVELPFPTPSERVAFIEAELVQRGATLAPDIDGHAVVRRYALDPRRLQAAVEGAVAAAAERGSDQVDARDLGDACRAQLRHDLTSLAERVTSSYSWGDLVIPVDVYHGLCEMVAHMRHARRVFEDWELGRRHGLSQGLSALFAGPPGTGKTMCASVIARELDMELFRIDLSRVVSKWIGETEKNLSRLFDEAQRSHAIILFDEADSLFAKRTAVRSSVDRYANLEVNYLLQRMEAFSGVTILTTNFEDTIDTAFKRRLSFRLRFERPDAQARASLWQKVFPPACAVGGDFDAGELGRRFDLSGGSIRNAAVRAAFLAAAEDRAVTQRDCEQAAEREAQEMGLLAHSSTSVRPPPSLSPPSLSPPRPENVEHEPPPRSAPRLVPISHPRSR